MGRKVAVIGAHRLGCLVESNLVHPRVCVDSREIGAPNRPVLVEQKAGTKQAAIVVSLDRLLQMIDCFVNAIFLLEQECRIQPRCRVLGIERPREVEFLVCERVLFNKGKGFPQITAQE